MGEVWIVFGLTVFAGMATAIGSIIAFTASRTNYRFLSVATGFSAGVMLYVSFVEIFLKALAWRSPWRLRSTTSPKGSAFRFRFFTLRETARGPSATRY